MPFWRASKVVLARPRLRTGSVKLLSVRGYALSARLKRCVYALMVLLVSWAVVLAVSPAVAKAQGIAAPAKAAQGTNRAAAEATARITIVRPGDSLWSISTERLRPNATPQRIMTEVERIYALNRNAIGDDPNLLLPGQQLSLPPIGKPAAERPPEPVATKPASKPAVRAPVRKPAPEGLPTPAPAPTPEPFPKLASAPVNGLVEGAFEWSAGHPVRALAGKPMYLATILVALIALYLYGLAIISAWTRIRNDPGYDDLLFILLVPALNEERVIGKTIASLLALRGNFLILVIDDASDDGTVAAVAPFLADPRVQLLEQPPERARCGKGHALNAGYTTVQRSRLVKLYGPENVIVVVFDSDARVEPNFLQAVTPYFRDPKVAGVQSAVRMYNANQNLLTVWQNLEFTIWGNILCRAKNRLGSATLGGNGQCTRLAALTDMGPEPWQASSLTEDLDLSLRLLVKGWQLRFCPSVSVCQEAVPELGKLVRQRSRWIQGHLVCWQHLPSLLRSNLPLRGRLDLLLFLLLPAAIIPVGLASIDSWSDFLLSFGHWSAGQLLVWYVLGFVVAPLAMASLKANDRRSLWWSVLHGHLFVFYSFVWFLAGTVACWNVMRGRRAWAKTSRAPAGFEAEPLRPSTSQVVPKEEIDEVRRLLDV